VGEIRIQEAISWEDNIKVDFIGLEWEGVDWSHVAWCRNKLQAFVKKVMTVLVF
jgi:hypothetical protein